MSISARTAELSGSSGPLLTLSTRQTTVPRKVFTLDFSSGASTRSAARRATGIGGLAGPELLLAASLRSAVDEGPPAKAGAVPGVAVPAPMRSTILPPAPASPRADGEGGCGRT